MINNNNKSLRNYIVHDLNVLSMMWHLISCCK